MQWGELVDVVVARTGFDVDIVSEEAAAIIIIVSTDFTFHQPVSQQGVRGTEPVRKMGPTPVHIHTRIWHLNTGALQEHTIPSLPSKPIIMVMGSGLSVAC